MAGRASGRHDHQGDGGGQVAAKRSHVGIKLDARCRDSVPLRSAVRMRHRVLPTLCPLHGVSFTIGLMFSVDGCLASSQRGGNPAVTAATRMRFDDGKVTLMLDALDDVDPHQFDHPTMKPAPCSFAGPGTSLTAAGLPYSLSSESRIGSCFPRRSRRLTVGHPVSSQV